MDNCLFCKIIKKEIPSFKIFDSVYVYAFLDVFPNSKGHTLIIPKKHFDNFMETDEFYVKEVARVKHIVAKMLKETLNPVGFNYVSNQGSEAFQQVFHYHEHIVPKYQKELGYKPTVNVGDVKVQVDQELADLIRTADK